MSISLYNTLSKKKEPFTPLAGNKVRMYVCGVTVYDMCHIGHARSLVVFDVIARFLRRKGYDLTYVRNFTDVDDKIIARANQLGLSYKEIAQKYIDEFYTDMKVLKVKPADIEPRATEHIEQIITMIEKLESKGLAYKAADGSVYFDVSGFREYGKLSGRDTEEMIAGARVEIDENKRNPLDFALWKRSKEGEPWWESPWSKGRPGWHIECSAMSMKYLGETFDIHCGGIDLVFPHHENEIAQSECATGRPFARYWVHPEFLIVEGEKMSKSLGNFLTLRDLTAQGYAPEAIRYLLLSVHYRKQLNFTMDGLHQAAAAIDRLEDFLLRAREKASDEAPTPEFKAEAAAARVRFREAMDSDINTSAALAALFDFVRAANQRDSRGALTGGDARLAIAFLEEVDGVFNILRGRPEILDEEIARQIEARQEARRRRDFAEADRIRDQLLAEGIQLEDTREGVRWKRSAGAPPVK